MSMESKNAIETSQQGEFKDQVIYVGRVTKVVKGGKNFSFSALVVVGDGRGKVGFGLGKALEVPSAIKKGIESAKRNMIKVSVTPNGTIPHPVLGRFGSGSVMLKPAPEGTGVIAGATVRAIMEAVGISNVLTKSLGSSNPHNVVRATFAGFQNLMDPYTVMTNRGIDQAEA
ncbi:MAG: 30S ribosomal protein S5 [Acidobacteria bacterium ADurb.Bin340]|nr:MAG: 30S ribosomal protein S5 [Acidobacteria bacterium ADurb.Bin340]HOD32344.1 30S ribosomal protein S5 [Holophaga sp.]HQL48091.1 30S ribosomal protein S5 [Holophaga sp.]